VDCHNLFNIKIYDDPEEEAERLKLEELATKIKPVPLGGKSTSNVSNFL
jgi:hypothetical protein